MTAPGSLLPIPRASAEITELRPRSDLPGSPSEFAPQPGKDPGGLIPRLQGLTIFIGFWAIVPLGHVLGTVFWVWKEWDSFSVTSDSG